jgi:hypothetical protein
MTKRELLYLIQNTKSMKRKLISGAWFLFIAWAFTSCDPLSDCGFCKEVTYENNSVVNEGPETEYCGADLVKQKAIQPVTIGALTTKVECR